MATQGDLALNLTFVGGVDLTDVFSITSNLASPAQVQIIDLASGANTITVPTGGSSLAVGVIMIPPTANTNVLTIKGVGGDTGIAVHRTNPTYIGLDSVTSFVVNAGAATAGARFIFV